jgi:hypothetical protein
MASQSKKFATQIAAVALFVCGNTTVRAARTPRQASAEQKEVTNFRLSTDKLNKYEAAVKAYNKLVAANPTLKKQMDAESGANDHNTVAGSVAVIEKHPLVVNAIEGAGLSTRGYVVMTYALINTDMAVGMKKKGMIKEYPASVSPANAAFVEQNYSRINALMSSMGSSDDSKQ